MRVLAASFAVAVVSCVLAFTAVRPTYDARSREWSHSRAEWQVLDWRFQRRGDRPTTASAAILAFDDATDEALGERFPYRRSRYADVINSLCAAGASAVVFDVQFLEQTVAREDRAVLDASRRANRGGCGVVFATAQDSSRSYVDVPLPFASVERDHDLVPGEPIAYARASYGLSGVDEASDHVARWETTTARVPVQGARRDLPSLALAALQASGRAVDERAMPDHIMINYAGDRRSFPWHPFEDTQPDVRSNLARPADLGWARGKTVFVGATSQVLQDIHDTPFGKMPGVVVHANAYDNLRARSWLREQDPGATRWLALAFGLVVWALLALLPFSISLPGCFAVVTGYVAYGQWAFAHGKIVWVVPPVASAIAVFGSVVILLAAAALRDRRRVAGLFARYVSPDVVRELVEMEELEVGGERRVVTVLFSDIRGFTSLSEHLDPGELVDQLNEYFDEMVQAVELQRGTLDKFIGDGMMAIFGAPLDMPDHADRACAAALDMVERLELLNEQRVERGLAELAIGVGLNTGEAIVGNIGSPLRRVDFTAIGDAVNLASRMESSTKEIGVKVLASESTAAQVTGFGLVPRGSIVVKGRTQATAVFEVTPKQVGTVRCEPGSGAPHGAKGEAA